MRPALLVAVGLLAGCDDFVIDTTGGDGSGSRSDAILALTGDATAGDLVFDDHCIACHDKAGVADQVGPALGPAVASAEDAALVSVILDGSGAMPAQNISDDQDVADLLAWMRQTFP
jgi:mono/diheme cytochrome c family protein